MLSLYIHIPFCQTKCPYCSFQVCPIGQLKNENFKLEIQKYTDSLLKEIEQYSQILSDKKIKSIYFGGGTPQLIGFENIEKIIDTISQNFDLEDLGELSLEMNPYPHDQVINIVQKINQKYRSFPRLRFSFGIQSFDNYILSQTDRDITFPALVELFRDMQKIKKENNIFNLDFIAFGYFHTTRKGNIQLWNQESLAFFQNLAQSKFIDSYSLYTLEIFPGSLWYYQKNQTSPINQNLIFNMTDDDIYEEFAILKDFILNSGYKRYELSNFSLMGKSSIHNRVYREMGDYIGLGTSASSFIKNSNAKLKKYLGVDPTHKSIRWTNTVKLADYYQGKVVDQSSIQNLSSKDFLIEEFFLALRTDLGVNDLDKFKTVLDKDYKSKLDSYSQQGFIIKKENGIQLTDSGMDIYNDIVTELLSEI